MDYFTFPGAGLSKCNEKMNHSHFPFRTNQFGGLGMCFSGREHMLFLRETLDLIAAINVVPFLLHQHYCVCTPKMSNSNGYISGWQTGKLLGNLPCS